MSLSTSLVPMALALPSFLSSGGQPPASRPASPAAGRDAQYSIEQVEAQLRAVEGALARCDVPSQAANSGRTVETLLKLTEALVWGERHNGALFDLFCERQALPGFVAALLASSTPQPVRLQLLQTLSILVANARRPTTTYYLFSGGHLNTLLSGEPDLRDEEVRAYFVTFVKSLALRLDTETALLFIDRRSATADGIMGFPLFAQAVRFVTYKDHMCSTAARAALLSLLSIDHPDVRQCTVHAARQLLVPCLAQGLRVAWAATAAAVHLWDAETLGRAMEAEEDLHGFVAELLELHVQGLTEVLVPGLLVAALLPLLTGLAPPLAYPEHDATDMEPEGPGTPQSRHSKHSRNRPEDREAWLSLDDAMEDPSAVPDVLLRSPSAGSAREPLARTFSNLSKLSQAQQGLVGAVFDHIMFGKPLKGHHKDALTKPVEPLLEMVPSVAEPLEPLRGLVQRIETQLFGPKRAALLALADAPPPEPPPEAEAEALPDEPPMAAVALRAVAVSVWALGGHRSLVEPLTQVLLGPTVQSTLVTTVYTTGSQCILSSASNDAVCVDTAAELLTCADDAVASRPHDDGVDHADSDTVPSVLIPNPFREALLAPLGGGGAGATQAAPVATPEAPLAAWALRELLAACPEAQVLTPPPARFLGALRAEAGLPRIAQRCVAKALLQIVAPPREPAAWHALAHAAAVALREEAGLLRKAVREAAEDCSGAEAQDVVAAFLEEWEWHSQRSQSVDLRATCGSPLCLLQCAHGNEQGPQCDGLDAFPGSALHMRPRARALLALRRLCDELAAGPGGGGAVAREEEPCPLRAGGGSAEGAGAAASCEEVACTGPSGDGCCVALRPTRLELAHLGVAGREVFLQAPAWRVGAAPAGCGCALLVSVKRGGPCGPGAAASGEPEEVKLGFATAEAQAAVLRHLERGRAQEVQRLLLELASFVDCVADEAFELEHIAHSKERKRLDATSCCWP